MADETIVIRFVAETDAAVKQAQAVRMEIDRAKEQLKALADQYKITYQAAARALKEAYENQRKAQPASPATQLGAKGSTGSKTASADVRAYNQSVNAALKEILAAETAQGAAAEEKAARVRAANQSASASDIELVQATNQAAAAAIQGGRASVAAASEQMKAAQLARTQAQAQLAAQKVANSAAESAAGIARINAQAQRDQAQANLLSAKAARENAAAQKTLLQAQVVNAQQVQAALGIQKEQARVVQEQAKAARMNALAQQEAAKAAFAYQTAASQASILAAQAAQAQAAAAVAPQLAAQRVQQAAAATAAANARVQQSQANAYNAVSNAAANVVIKQNQVISAQNRAAGSALNTSRATNILANSVARSQTAMSAFGKIAGFVFGGVLGLSAVTIVHRLIAAFNRLVDAGLEVSQSMFRLGASVRALQRLGMDITIGETVDQVEKLRESLGFMSRKEAVDGIAAIQLLTRNFGFTKDEMLKMTEASTALAVVTGKDFGEAARELAMFLSSGYAESLQRAGLAVNRLTVVEEAHRMGIRKGYTALTEQERAAAAYRVVMEQIQPILAEVSEYQDTLAGRTQAANAEIKTQKDAISQYLAPVRLAFVTTFKTIIEWLLRASNTWNMFAASFATVFVIPILSFLETLKDAYSSFLSGDWMDWQGFWAKYQKNLYENAQKRMKETIIIPVGAEVDSKTFEDAGKDLSDAVRKGFRDRAPEIRQDMVDAIDDASKQAIDLARDLNDELQKIKDDYAKDIGAFDPALLDSMVGMWDSFFSANQNLTVEQLAEQKANWEKFFGDFGEITSDGLNKAWEIWRKYYQKLDDISTKEQQDIADAERKLAQDLEDLRRDTQQKLEDAARKYREAELKAERDYQEKLRRLREEYLFDLEDALRERDALQVIRLMRRYALDKQQLERENENDAQERADNYRQELEDIRTQAARKEEELRIEHQRRLEEIRLQAERERAEAQIEREQAMEELKQDLENQRKEREIQYQQQLEDLKKKFENELTTILQKLQEQYNLTDTELKQIGDLFTAIYGPNGPVASAYSDLSNTLGDMTSAIGNAVSQAQEYLRQMAVISDQVVSLTSQIQSAAGTAMSSLSQMQQANYGYGAPSNSPPSAPPGFWPQSTPPYSGGNGTFNPSWPGGYTAPSYNPAPDPLNYLYSDQFRSRFSHALGGSVYANTPTMALFGEGGPEIASFMPINRMNTFNKSPVSRNPLAGSGQEGRMRLEIALGPDLEARIIDNTLGQSAEIIETALAGRS